MFHNLRWILSNFNIVWFNSFYPAGLEWFLSICNFMTVNQPIKGLNAEIVREHRMYSTLILHNCTGFASVERLEVILMKSVRS